MTATAWVWLGIGLLAIPVTAAMLGFCIAHIIDACCKLEHRLCHCQCCIQEYEYL